MKAAKGLELRQKVVFKVGKMSAHDNELAQKIVLGVFLFFVAVAVVVWLLELLFQLALLAIPIGALIAVIGHITSSGNELGGWDLRAIGLTILLAGAIISIGLWLTLPGLKQTWVVQTAFNVTNSVSKVAGWP